MKSNKLKKVLSGVSAFAVMSMAAAPLTAGADSSVFSGKGAYGDMDYYVDNTGNGGSDLEVFVFENASKSGSSKTNSSGAEVLGISYNGDYTNCWWAYGSTDTVLFSTNGSIPMQVTASGSVQVTWYDCWGVQPSFTETMPFVMNLSANRDDVESQMITGHSTYGNITVSGHSDYSRASAVANGSSISSPFLGTVTPSRGWVGHSRDTGHTITK